MTLDEIRKVFRERGIRKVKVGGFDVDGVLRGKYLSVERFLSAADRAVGFPDVIFARDVGDAAVGGRGTGPEAGAHPDVPAKVDLSTMRVTPWEPDTATFLVDFRTPEGVPHPACVRSLLQSVLARAKAQGLSPKVAVEQQFWLFTESPQTLREKKWVGLQTLTPGTFGFSWLRTGQQREIVHDLIDTLRSFDIEVERLHAESGPGMFEAALRHDDALKAADKAALFKTSVKQVAFHHNLTATFMARWHGQLPGASGHLHQSLCNEAGANVFFDAGAEHGLSRTARHYLGGQLALMPELTALVAPTVNSYKRTAPGALVPVNVSWGIENRTCAVRAIPAGKTGTRLEFRQTAADLNPYVAIAANVAAGLWGIENQIAPPPPVRGDAAARTELSPLPRTLRAANEALAKSEKARSLLGEAFIEHWVRTRDWEVRQNDEAVTDWELERYFESI